VNSLPKTVTRQRRSCDLNPGHTAPESSTLTARPSSIQSTSRKNDQLKQSFTGDSSKRNETTCLSCLSRERKCAEPKIIIKLFFNTAISIFVISSHNGYRVLFDKIASVYFIIFEKCIYILALEKASPRNQH